MASTPNQLGDFCQLIPTLAAQKRELLQQAIAATDPVQAEAAQQKYQAMVNAPMPTLCGNAGNKTGSRPRRSGCGSILRPASRGNGRADGSDCGSKAITRFMSRCSTMGRSCCPLPIIPPSGPRWCGVKEKEDADLLPWRSPKAKRGLEGICLGIHAQLWLFLWATQRSPTGLSPQPSRDKPPWKSAKPTSKTLAAPPPPPIRHLSIPTIRSPGMICKCC
jgi:hypothetical protein